MVAYFDLLCVFKCCVGFQSCFKKFPEMEESLEGASSEKVDFVNVDLGALVDLEVQVKVEKCEEDYDLPSCGGELTFVNVKTEPGELGEDGKVEDPLEQPHTCEEPGCMKTFPNKFTLEKHRRVHTMCRIPGCFEAFASRKKLVMHERWHLKQMSHPCPVPKCGKAFRAKADLNRHMKVLHKEKRESLVELQTQSPPPSLNLSAESFKSVEVSDTSPKKMKIPGDSHCQGEVFHLKEKKLSWPGPDCGSKPSDKGSPNDGLHTYREHQNHKAHSKGKVLEKHPHSLAGVTSLVRLKEGNAVKRDSSHFQQDEATVTEEYTEKLN